MPTDYRRIAEKNIRKYGTDINRYGPVLLAQLYSDRTHFIYEILQNAEDAQAREISFYLFQDRLEVRHNGRLFNEADVQGICGLVEGTKRDDLTQIGKFGIGFKSVYAYTESPKIYSGNEAFCIGNYVQPSAIDQIPINHNETLFVFPFNHNEIEPNQAFLEISKKLRDIGARTLLFLNHIKEIVWNINERESGNYICDTTNGEGHKKVYVISKVGEESVEGEEWLVFEKPLDLNNHANLKVEVAFKIEKDRHGKEKVGPARDSKLIVFFPTEKPTYLNFLIQGPYKTTPNRENIPFENEDNKFIVTKTGSLIAESLSIMKRLGFLYVNLLNVLPIDSGHIESEPIYAAIFDAVKSKLLSDEELLPTHNGNYTKASDALLAQGKDLPEFLSQEDTAFLFNKMNWISTDITAGDLRNYLIGQLKIREIDFENLANLITPEFLERKSDEWLIDFYGRLLDQRSLWKEGATNSQKKGILRKKPIIRLTNNTHIAPYDEDGNIQVYLPTGFQSEYNTVKRELVGDDKSRKFLTELGLYEPDLFAEIIEKILPKYQTGEAINLPGYLADFEKVINFFDETDSTKKTEQLISKLSEIPFILSTHGDFKFSDKVYQNTQNLKEYFGTNPSTSFVSEELYKKYGLEKLNNFLKKIKVLDVPKRVEYPPELNDEDKARLRKEDYEHQYIWDKEIVDYDLDGLEDFFCNDFNENKSLILWKIILKIISPLRTWDAKNYFLGKYIWIYKKGDSGKKEYESTKNFDSKLLKTLRNHSWLVSTDGRLKKSSEITFSELSDKYPYEELNNIDVLKEVLSFKPDVFDQLPNGFKSKLELVKERSPKEIKEALALFDKQKTAKEGENQHEDHWIPKFKPGAIELKSEMITPEPLEPSNLENQAETIKENDTEDKGSGQEEKTEPKEESKFSSTQKKEIGNWGEQSVLIHLRKQYQNLGIVEDTDYGFRCRDANNRKIEVFWLNINSEAGKGYDFVLREDNIETEYIEVKTKLGEEKELIIITGTQWEFARNLFNQNKGEKYWIYAVLNAGQSNARIKKIQNPIKLWKEGRLYAHPVQFKL